MEYFVLLSFTIIARWLLSGEWSETLFAKVDMTLNRGFTQIFEAPTLPLHPVLTHYEKVKRNRQREMILFRCQSLSWHALRHGANIFMSL
jgi:hypothetical protein